MIQKTPLGLLNLVGRLFRFCVFHHSKESIFLQQNLLGSYCFLFLIKQVTLVTGEPVPPEFSHVLKFGDVSYNLYSHSFLHLGLVSCARKYWLYTQTLSVAHVLLNCLSQEKYVATPAIYMIHFMAN